MKLICEESLSEIQSPCVIPGSLKLIETNDDWPDLCNNCYECMLQLDQAIMQTTSQIKDPDLAE